MLFDRYFRLRNGLGSRLRNRFFGFDFFLDLGSYSGLGLYGLLVCKSGVERGDCSAEKVVLQAGYLLDDACC